MGRTAEIGNQAEKLALGYLRKQGLKQVSQNYHCRYGEIDLILNDKRVLVFVEVRYRKNNQFGGAAASVTPAKQQKLRNTAEHYLQSEKKTTDACRFDILCLSGELTNPQINWIKNAF